MDTNTADDRTVKNYSDSCGKCAARGPVRCNRCGCYAVAWAKTNAGKFYMIAATPGRSFNRAFTAPHKCDTHRAAHGRSVLEAHDAYYWHHAQHAR